MSKKSLAVQDRCYTRALDQDELAILAVVTLMALSGASVEVESLPLYSYALIISYIIVTRETSAFIMSFGVYKIVRDLCRVADIAGVDRDVLLRYVDVDFWIDYCRIADDSV